MSDQIEELIREIAAKHGIAVARDDPILVLQTINLRLLKDSADAQQQQLKEFAEQMEVVSMRWKLDSTEKAERVLNAALSYSKGAADQILKEHVQNIEETIKSEISTLLDSITRQNQWSRRHALINLIASCLTVSSLVVAIAFLR